MDGRPLDDETGAPAPGLGVGFAVLLVVVGLLLLGLAWGAVVVVLQIVRSISSLS
jgi:hypothetical protein